MAVTFTGTQLIRRSLTLIGAIAVGETPSAADAQDALAILNGLLDSYATQRLALPASGRNVFTTTDNVSTYLVGPGATFNMTRPVSIDNASVLSNATTPTFEIPMVAFSDAMYQSLVIKDLTAAFPTNYYYNATNLATGSLFLWPTPTQSATYQVVLYTPTLLTQVSALTDSFTMAPGYYRMLYYNLARELAPAFTRPLDPDVRQLATDSLADIKRVNLEMFDLDTSASLPGTGGIYSVYSDSNY